MFIEISFPGGTHELVNFDHVVKVRPHPSEPNEALLVFADGRDVLVLDSYSQIQAAILSGAGRARPL